MANTWIIIAVKNSMLKRWNKTDFFLIFDNKVLQKLYTTLRIVSFWKWNIPFSMAEDESHDKFIDLGN